MDPQPLFKVIDYRSVRGEVNHYMSQGNRHEMRAIGQLRSDGTYTPVTTDDAASNLSKVEPEKFFPVGLPRNPVYARVTVRLLNELFEANPDPSPEEIKDASRAAWFEICEAARKHQQKGQ